MRDVDLRIRIGRCGQEPVSRQFVDEPPHLRDLASCDGCQFRYRRRTADLVLRDSRFSKALEQLADNAPVAGIALRELIDGFVGRAVQGLHDAAADGLIVLDPQPLPVGDVPHPRERELDQRQLIDLVCGIVQQRLHESRRDARADHRDRPFHGQLQLAPLQPRHQKLSVVQGLREPGKSRALAEELRAHRQHDEDLRPLAPRGFERAMTRRAQQEVDELGRHLALRGQLDRIAHELFELIHQNEQILVGLELVGSEPEQPAT